MKSVFQTTDGLLFDTEAEANSHEKVLVNKEAIAKWAEEQFGDKQGQATRVTNIVLTWEGNRDYVLA